MVRFACLVWMLTFAATFLLANGGSPDPVFSQIHSDQWLSQGDRSHMHWSTGVSEPELSNHQRLVARVFARVDGGELARRRGKGQFLVLVQVKDAQGRVWQNHQEMDLAHVEEGIKANDALFTQLFFVLPGEYGISIALFDTATGEHSVVRRKLHVSPLKNDPLPDAWRDLPAVQFVGPQKPPDSWLLPSIGKKLSLAVETREPAHVSLLVNLTPSERFEGSSRVQNRNLAALLPSAKVLSQIGWKNATFSLALLDLARRRIAWQQDDMDDPDWWQAAGSLAEVNPGIIDVKSLANRKHSAQFFLDEIGRRIGTPKGSPILIVLSSPVEFEPGQEMSPIARASASNARVFYIRYQPLPPLPAGRRQMLNATLPPRAGFVPPVDQLAPLLKPLDPRLFEVSTPEQFRKALANIIGEISKL